MWPDCFYYVYPLYHYLHAAIELHARSAPLHQQRAKRLKAAAPKRHRTYSWH
jgi:hypothetical protein